MKRSGLKACSRNAKLTLTILGIWSIFAMNKLVYAGSSASSVPLPGLDAATLERMPLPEFYEKLRELGFFATWSYLPGKQAASYSKDFWCAKTWIVRWRVEMSDETPIATEVDITFINACE